MKTDLIIQISKVFLDANIKFALIGSSNLKLQGMDVEPKDIDLVITERDLDKTVQLFETYNPSKRQIQKGLSSKPFWEITFFLEGIEVQIMSEAETGEYVRILNEQHNLTKMEMNGISIPCFTLEAEAKAYESTQREQKAKNIRKFIEAKQ